MDDDGLIAAMAGGDNTAPRECPAARGMAGRLADHRRDAGPPLGQATGLAGPAAAARRRRDLRLGDGRAAGLVLTVRGQRELGCEPGLPS
jgi:hypothetical protein